MSTLWHAENAILWNESSPAVSDEGLINRQEGTGSTLNIFIITKGTIFFFDEDGRFSGDGIVFYISNQELDNNSFTIISGRTHIEYNGEVFRVVETADKTHRSFTKLIECKALKQIGSY